MLDFVDTFGRADTMAVMAEGKARRKRRRFTEAFKAGALDEGKTVGAVPLDLDVVPSALRRLGETGAGESHERPHRVDDHGA